MGRRPEGVGFIGFEEPAGPWLLTSLPSYSFVTLLDCTPGGATLEQRAELVAGYKALGFIVGIVLSQQWGDDIVGHARDLAIKVQPDYLLGPNEPDRDDTGGLVDPSVYAKWMKRIQRFAFLGLGHQRPLLGGCELSFYDSEGVTGEWWSDFLAAGGAAALDFKSVHGYGLEADVGETPVARAQRVLDFHATAPHIPTVCTETCFFESQVTAQGGTMSSLLNAERAAIMAAGIPFCVFANVTSVVAGVSLLSPDGRPTMHGQSLNALLEFVQHHRS